MPGRARRRNKRDLTALQDEEDDDYHLSVPLTEIISGSSVAAVPTLVERTSTDGRRIYAETLPVDPPSPVKRMRLGLDGSADATHMHCDDDPPLPTFDLFNEFDADLDSERYDMDLGGVYDLPAPKPTRKKARPKITPSDKSMHEWRELRDDYLRLVLRLEGCGDASEDVCPSCNVEEPTIRCYDCFGEELHCTACTVEMHAKNPLHVIDVWDGSMFQRTSLKNLGLRVQLCHKGCVSPVPVDNFVLLDLGYIHELSVDFCGCEKRHGTPRWTEVIRKRWYPATHDTPRTAATFNYLDFFVIQTHQAKTTMFDFYTATARATCGTGKRPPNRYPEFLRMTRQWRHLQMLKRAGRGHDPSGVKGTKPGGLAIDCPACPRPDVNLPDDWENAPASDKFLYILFIALDACFRLKRRAISSELRDPGLGTGWAYFVEQEPYRQHLLMTTNETEMSTCSGLAALDYANTKFSRGYSTTGVGMGVCARHEFVQPTGVGDLQKGERYSNMDWVFSAIMRWKNPRLPKVVSYDIICQWFLKLFERLLNMPPAVRFFIVTSLYRFVIPKMHIHSHTLACQLLFSLNFLLGAGQTDGEGIERPWANLGGVATSTREMGPGSRRDTLDSHLSYWNWTKLIGIADLLRRRLDKARIEEREQSEVFDAFSLEQGERVEGWRAMVHAFEANPKAPNPYEATTKDKTEAEVRLSLSEEEGKMPSLHDVSPSGFIYAGLDLEEQQRRVRVNIELKKAQTTAQKIDIVAMRRKLSRGITRFRKLQATYMPGALQVLARRPAVPEETPETTPLMLPSALTAEDCEAGCVGGVQYTEATARDGQCGAALLRLRHQLHVKSRFMTYKKNNSRHQHANTRSRTLVARNESKIRLHSEKYQTAWASIRSLYGGDASRVGWRKLRQADIRMMEDSEDARKRNERRKKENTRRRAQEQRLIAEGERVEEDNDEEGWEDDNGDEPGAPTTESRRLVSWIWTTAGTTGSDIELEEALRIEWAKAYARTRRWKEEVRLLQEEYRRILVSFEYEARRWEGRICAIRVGVEEVGFAQGAIAYALRQAAMYRDIAARAVVTMTEVRRGRGRRRLPASVLQEGESAVGDATREEGESGNNGAREDGAGEGEGTEGESNGVDEGVGDDDGGEDSGDESDDDEERYGIASDEEFFLGGEDEAD
ncbi:hypothetical protein C8F04DRAFT_1176799 [Mycena alexandri]|uniref:CxC2-like cysteine cluster KDZ transposase-associated domain-containing protein n=1 Tax=Mycena alexandri TaxID=1745969 RepID=A0AAD6XBA8_9AGAR|nr:hypothetical protein C8F04DRAFT_1176799 [Mycena alexandri]